MSRRWVSSRCRSTSGRDNFRFRSVVSALNASMPPYRTEYLGVFSPARMSGKCFSDSSSHEVTWAIMSLIDQVPVTQDCDIVDSGRPEYASLSVCQASSMCFKSCDRFKLSSRKHQVLEGFFVLCPHNAQAGLEGRKNFCRAAVSFNLLLGCCMSKATEPAVARYRVSSSPATAIFQTVRRENSCPP